MSVTHPESPVDFWGALLARDESVRDAAGLRRWFEEREMTVPGGDGPERPLCTVLRPQMIDREAYRRQARAAELVVVAARKVRDGVVADPALHLRLSATEITNVSQGGAVVASFVVDPRFERQRR